jgi:hypothetical protein
MTISSSLSRIDYVGNGSTTVFAFPYYFLADADLVVVLRDMASGAETTLALGTDYSVAGAGALSGGTVTMASAPSPSETFTIRRQLALVQETDFVANDPLSAEVLERAIDRVVMALQQQDEVQARTLQFPVSDSPTLSTSLPPSTVRASRNLGFNAAGEPIAVDSPVVDNTALIVVGGTTPVHQTGRFWVDTGTANTLIIKQSDGADWIELWRVDAAGNGFLHQSDVILASADAGAGQGPTLTLDRASASPAASDLLGGLTFQGRSTTGVARGYARLLADILDATNASEDGRLLFQTAVAGTLATRLTLRDRLLLAVALETAKGAAVASAAATDIWSAGDGTLLHVTGTTTITSLGTAPQAGAVRLLLFDAALTLTHGASLVLNAGGANITTAAGDMAVVVADTTTRHYCYLFRASGATVAPALLHFQYQVASNTAIPSYSAAAWRTVLVNTKLVDSGNYGSVASNQMTLSPGTYVLIGAQLTGPAISATNRTRWRNVTDGITAFESVHSVISLSAASATHANVLRGTFAIAASKTFEFQIYPSGTVGGAAAGAPLNNGDNEIYTDILLMKVA